MIKVFDCRGKLCPEVFSRTTGNGDVAAVVSEILKNVRENGDSALLKYCRKFDNAEPGSLEVTKSEIDKAFEKADKEFVSALKKARENIAEFHAQQMRNGFIISRENGVVTGQKIVPLKRVGIYVPGGTAAYPSSVLMNAVPAKIAGVKEVIMATPSKGGNVNPDILAAAKIAGVDRIFKIGGAQAIAALAFGTETVPRVDKIAGPGNAYVAEAKKQVFGDVGIDMIAGPSEILIIADEGSRDKHLAADMLSQAEHDRDAAAVLITDSEKIAEEVKGELERQIIKLPRREIARCSIDNNGKIIIVDSIKTAVSLANKLAPEHLEICVDNPFDYLGSVENAGSVFLGRNCPEAAGDYIAGPNHTLPTGGTARFSSPLSVDDFVKKIQYTYYTKNALSEAAEDISLLAEKEGLSAHAKSVMVRFDKDNE
jgi:histidinol dehydrogenase